MTTEPRVQAHEIVAAFEANRGPGAWRLERVAVARRLHQLVESPTLLRQGGLSLCGPASLFHLWLKDDPVAAATYGTALFEYGWASLGALPVSASRGLRSRPFAASRCPQADWMMMAALRDSANRILPYSRPSGPREAAAGITMPDTLRGWLEATALFASVRDETRLLIPRGLGHARRLEIGGGQAVVSLVAQEMFRRPGSAFGRARDAVVSLVPNHWLVLTAPVTILAGDRVGLRFWSWGQEHAVEVAASRFARCYFGALVAAPVRCHGSAESRK